jgi:FkbM family methyltransferase
MATVRSCAWEAARLASQKGGVFSRALFQAASIYTKAYKNHNYNMRTNGEFHVLDRLSAHQIKAVLDVGANAGDYTNACLSRFPGATVHAFEIVSSTYQRLKSNVSSSRARLNCIGLSDREGEIVINYNPADDGSSSLHGGNRVHGGDWQALVCSTTTGDKYIFDNAIAHVDLLKIDVEGAENLVLEGLTASFGRKKISAVQFEFGMVNVYSKFLLKDFWEFFSDHGFVLGPVMPRGVHFKDYAVRDEDFQGAPNYLAVHRSQPELIAALRLGGKTRGGAPVAPEALAGEALPQRP